MTLLHGWFWSFDGMDGYDVMLVEIGEVFGTGISGSFVAPRRVFAPPSGKSQPSENRSTAHRHSQHRPGPFTSRLAALEFQEFHAGPRPTTDTTGLQLSQHLGRTVDQQTETDTDSQHWQHHRLSDRPSRHRLDTAHQPRNTFLCPCEDPARCSWNCRKICTGLFRNTHDGQRRM